VIRKRKILSHTAFWAAFVLLGIILNVAWHNNNQVTWPTFYKDLKDPFTAVGYGRTILVCYISLYIFGKLISEKKYIAAAASIFLMIAADVLLRYLIEQKFIGPCFGKWQYPEKILPGQYFSENVLFSAFGIFFCFTLKIFDDLYHQEQVEKEKNAMELKFLKSQINPHFLLNTFNNLYGLSLSEPEKTPDAIMKLSEMMRYVLHESNTEKVPLKKEIAYLSHLISIQKLRYERPPHIWFDTQGITDDHFIAPLLLISFVENAFKHGEVTDLTAPLVIHILVEDHTLLFYTKNKISDKNKDSMGGIGLQNVKRRLNLLYPGRHTLNITDEGPDFEVLLTIKLNG